MNIDPSVYSDVMTTDRQLAVETDTALAAIYERQQKLLQEYGWHADTLLRVAGFKQYSSKLVTGSVEDAIVKVGLMLCDHAELPSYKDDSPEANEIRHAYYARRPWGSSSPESAERAIIGIDAVRKEWASLAEQVEAHTATWRANGFWSRFFIVRNATGHIHSSLFCSTCRPSTSFGWLPDLSGLTEAEAVAEHGAILCTRCFPSAPVEYTNSNYGAEQRARKAAAKEAKS